MKSKNFLKFSSYRNSDQDSYENRHNYYNSSNSKVLINQDNSKNFEISISMDSFEDDSSAEGNECASVENTREKGSPQKRKISGNEMQNKEKNFNLNVPEIEKKKGFFSKLLGLCCLATE